MSQTSNLLTLFKTHGNRLSTAFLSSDAVHGIIGTKYTGRISDLRAKGYIIEDLGDQGHGNHVYELKNPDLGGCGVSAGVCRKETTLSALAMGQTDGNEGLRPSLKASADANSIQPPIYFDKKNQGCFDLGYVGRPQG